MAPTYDVLWTHKDKKNRPESSIRVSTLAIDEDAAPAAAAPTAAAEVPDFDDYEVGSVTLIG